ncbi:di-trans,poly-cis-decaprenylcistransferase [Patescibacteria group bacterium]|nr:di-trans,poly-cis-decaprenylcistransferase [Patescibacteria group bacterium]
MTKRPLVKTPQHVAIIMDGNRRWAASRGFGPVDGHRVAAEETIEPVIERAIERGIKYLTFWAFSTENRNRDKVELAGLFRVFRHALKTKIKKLAEKGVKIRLIGDINWFPKDIAKRVMQIVSLTKDNNTITVSFALNYGGRDEILRAVKGLFKEVEVGRIKIEKLTELDFEKHLDTKGIPDPELIIRTGGETRLSGYLPWQSVYSELYFTEVLFPDFTPREFDKALFDYQKRDRRFGKGKFRSYKKRKKSISTLVHQYTRH